MAGRVKSYIGAAAPLYLAPLLFLNNMVLLHGVLLVTVFTVLETLPLAVVSLCPWVYAALSTVPGSDYESLVLDCSRELASLASFLAAYVAVDLTGLWRRVSLFLLQWQGARVRQLFASMMLFAFLASLVLPAAFVTWLLLACICPLVDHLEDDIIALAQQRMKLRAAHRTQRPIKTSELRTARTVDKHSPLRLSPLSLTISEDSQTSSPGDLRDAVSLPRPLSKMDDLTRQLMAAYRSACMESPTLRLLQASQRSLAVCSTGTRIADGFNRSQITNRIPSRENSDVQESSLACSSLTHQMSMSQTATLLKTQRFSRPPLLASFAGTSLQNHTLRPFPVPSSSLAKESWSTQRPPVGASTPQGSQCSMRERYNRSTSRSPTSPHLLSSRECETALSCSGIRLQHPQSKSYSSMRGSSETERPSHGSLSSKPSPAITSPEHSDVRTRTVFPTGSVQSSMVTKRDTTASGKSRIEPTETLCKSIRKVFMVGVAYTSIIAGECGVRNRAKFIIDAYYTTDLSRELTKEYRLAIREIIREKWQLQEPIQPREVMGIVMLTVIGISLAIDTDRYIGMDATVVSSLCVLAVVGVPLELGNPMLENRVVTWQQVLRRMPWELVLVRLGGNALQLVAMRSKASAWFMESQLENDINYYEHPFSRQMGMLAKTALVSELGIADIRPFMVKNMVVMAERSRKHPLYFALPVALESGCVLLMPYTQLPLIFLHVYADVSCSELMWLGLLLKMLSSVGFVIAANTVLPEQ
ncbi:uncharacterized protein LOC119444062 [Dermacentor silvarum]|uniref:uncharacterized protein LOC119444062 n=1 Tax=Dermacentor silvarum TaxID=543639 RepID=UPI002100951C|nr:uncharacterized protein LOC119444062 [Dermacentor silvarum]